MHQKLLVRIIPALLLAASCSASGNFDNSAADPLTETWYGYLNVGQVPTASDFERYYQRFGYYPSLTTEQSRYLNVR